MNDRTGLLYHVSTSFLDSFSRSIFIIFLLLLRDIVLFFHYLTRCFKTQERSTQRFVSNERRRKKNGEVFLHGWQSTKLPVNKNYSLVFSIKKEALKDFFCYLINHVYIRELKVGILYNTKCIMNRIDRQHNTNTYFLVSNFD